ncbi:MAG: hypothetical protein DME26_04490 [Verrucomicrobia bacterium]|nr:MAG: hypothetical protein DME26_04490 [Verrucomicrobiota bacterium]
MNKKLNILVLEDVPEDAKFIERALSKSGLAFTVRRVASRPDFVKAVQDFRPNVILADYDLPRFNALEALEWMNEQPGDIPFILVTGSQSDEVAAECFKSGAADYVLKSNLQRLPSALMSALAKQAAEDQLKTSHERVRALSARAQARLESEKTRLAREIHDDLAQKLTALAIELSLLDSGFDYSGQEVSTQELRAKIKNLYELADGIIKSARRIEARLRPKVLDEFGLAAAIEWQTHEFEKETGIKCQFTAEPEDINVAYHASASRVSMRVEEKAGRLCLEVRDNGKGVTREQTSDPKSLGLLGMKERASLLSGTVHIEGAPGSGTLVRVLAPVKRSEERVGVPLATGNGR